MVEPHSLFTHILAQTRQNVQLLIAHGQISKVDGEEILSRLSMDGSVASLAQKTERLTMSPAPPKVEARAIWGWSSEDPNDLSFEEGDVIEIVTETNIDWWTGRNRLGKQGLFPSNYVEKLLPARSMAPILVPEPRKSMTPGPVQQRYASPALPHPSPRGPPGPSQYFPPPGPPPVNYSYGPPPGPPVPQPVPQQAPVKKSKFGGLGQVLAQSAAGGAGFGAGAAIGGDLVNALF